mgnify:CR=1 FL=1
MKLFKSLLIAPATLGLLAPMSATANELNLAEVSGYSSSEEVQNISEFYPKELAVTNSRVDGLEARINEFEAGSFSETTTASFSADFYLGAYDGGTTATNEPVQATYGFQIDLNTSFTGEDSLDISLDAGNTVGVDSASVTTSVLEFDGNSTADALVVDGVSYTFPLGEATVFVADNGDASALFTTACTYGGPTNFLDDCGNVNAGPTGGGVAAGGSYDFGNGFSLAAGYQATDAQENLGIMTEFSLDSYALNAAYSASNYGVSVTYSSVEDGILATSKEDTYTAFNGYYSPDAEGFPSISVGYEIGDDASETDLDEITSFFVGLQWDEMGPGSFGVAMGHSNTVESADEEYQYEAYYSYPINDGMTVTPVIFTKESATAGQDDATGFMVKTSFSF